MPDLHPLIVLRLSGVRTHNEAVEVWTDHREELAHYTFVLSQPGPPSINWPAKVDLRGGGYLRSVFAHDQLWFTSHAILGELFGNNQRAHIGLDYTVGFDSNAAQYLRDLVEGRSNPTVERFRKTLRHLAERRFNWELMPILLERAEAIVSNRDLDHVWRVVYASEYLSHCDLRHFAQTGELRLTSPVHSVITSTQRNLSEWHRVLASGEILRIRHSHSLYHLLLLKIALLHRARPAPRETCRNLCEFIEFMCGTVGINLPWMLWAAAGLFEGGGSFEPLRKLATPPDVLVRNSRNIAWDVMHYVDRRQLGQMVGRNGSFLIPYTLTCDRGLAQWFDQQAQRSCLIRGGERMPQFFSEFNIEGQVLQRYGQEQALVNVAARHLTVDAHAARAERLRRGQSDLEPLIAELEASVAQLRPNSRATL
jgi:hypothetical protein